MTIQLNLNLFIGMYIGATTVISYIHLREKYFEAERRSQKNKKQNTNKES